MSYASDLAGDIFAYLEASSGKVVSLFVVTPVGVTVRDSGDWRLPNGQAEVDKLTSNYDCYVLNWDKNLENTPADVPDDYDDEHEAVYEFDKGLLDIDNILNYFDFAYKAGEGSSYNPS